MFGKHHSLTQLVSAIALAVSVAVVAASSALATPDWYAYYTHGAGTSATEPAAVRSYLAGHAAATQGTAFAWDRLGANGQPVRPMSAAVESNQVPTGRGTGFNWGDAGIGAGFAAGVLVLLLVGAMRARTSGRRVLTT